MYFYSSPKITDDQRWDFYSACEAEIWGFVLCRFSRSTWMANYIHSKFFAGSDTLFFSALDPRGNYRIVKKSSVAFNEQVWLIQFPIPLRKYPNEARESAFWEHDVLYKRRMMVFQWLFLKRSCYIRFFQLFYIMKNWISGIIMNKEKVIS